jgi:hypothetical protein
MRAALLALLACSVASPADAAPEKVTFSSDVAPILQKRCQSCHRPGEVAPMSLQTFREARPYARAIRDAVVKRVMPPWPADRAHGTFRNDPSLTEDEIDVLVAWADTGAAEGDPKNLPAALTFEEGWNIGRPDAVIEMPSAFQVPASGVVDIVYVIVKTDFPEDRWIQAAEIRPGNRALVHHANAFIGLPSSRLTRQPRYGVPFFAPKYTGPPASASQPASDALVGYVPGYQWKAWQPGQAKLLPAGAELWFQVHYSTNGTAGEDRTKVGLVFAKEPPRERVVSAVAKSWDFKIPAGAANHPVNSAIELATDVKLISLHAHMHYRGKDYEYRAVYPNGETEILLRIPRWDFNWQLTYFLDRPRLLPRGTRIECTAHYDNSPGNRKNPNPNVDVTYGEQSWDEMMSGWIEIAFEPARDPKTLFVVKPTGTADR